MTIASEITDLQTNLTAAKNAVTAKGGTVGDTGLAGLASEIATIPSGGGGGGTDWGVLYFHPWTGERTGYAEAEDSCTASIQDVELFMLMMNNLGLASQHMLDHPAKGDTFRVDITAQDNGSNVWEVNFMTPEGLSSSETWYADNEPDWWEMNCGISLAIDSGATHISFTAVAQYMYNYDTSRTLSLELDQDSYESLTGIGEPFLGFIPPDSLYSFEFGRLATTTPYTFLGYSPNLESIDWTYATSLTTINPNFLLSCSSFNSPVVLPSTLTSIKLGFMSNCDSMVSTVSCQVPASAVIGGITTFSTDNVEAPCYTTGIKLSGTYASDWKEKFQDRDSSPYRKLILES